MPRAYTQRTRPLACCDSHFHANRNIILINRQHETPSHSKLTVWFSVCDYSVCLHASSALLGYGSSQSLPKAYTDLWSLVMALIILSEAKLYQCSRVLRTSMRVDARVILTINATFSSKTHSSIFKVVSEIHSSLCLFHIFFSPQLVVARSVTGTALSE